MEPSKQIAEWMRAQVKNANKKGVVFGLSGGVDSAVLAALSKMALGEDVLGLILPCKNEPQDVKLAAKVAKKLALKTKLIDLDNIFDNLLKVCSKGSKMAKANLKPRLRMTILYYFANSLDYLVAGAGNKTELTIGYFTKYGDGGVDILPLGGLPKSEVRRLAKGLGVPDEIIKRVPSAGLWHGQTDEGEIGIAYEELDKIIAAIEKNETKDLDQKNLAKVKKMMKSSEHKRCKIPTMLL